MADCNHDCNSCSANCSERENPGIAKSPMNSESNIKKVIGVVSGKGGVGKSSVTSMLAVAALRQGKKVAILDADITGPSIPKIFGVKEKATGSDDRIMPAVTEGGIKIISLNMFLEKDTDPVVWRGPMLGGVIQQFWSNVVWGDIDVMYVDMPPGTGDVALTVYQSLPVDGMVIVTSPQELVSMIVAKAVNMAEMMKVPVIAIVENMSYYRCPDCGTEHKIFGESHVDEQAAQFGIKNIAKLPIDSELSTACDTGKIEKYYSTEMLKLAKAMG